MKDTKQGRNTSVSAIVMAFNEERHIGGCLASLQWCDEVWVVDSWSTDRTADICRQYGSKVVQHEFENFAAMRNWALDNLYLAGDWVLFLDADERIPESLRDEILERIPRDNGKYDGYFFGTDQYFWGKGLRHADTNFFDLRLFRKGKARCPAEKIVQERLELLDGAADFLSSHRVAIAKDTLHEYMAKVNRYSNYEAVRMFRTGQEFYSTSYKSPSRIRQMLKHVFRVVPTPVKPLGHFLYLFIVLRGFRDGYRGFLYAVMESLYVFAGYVKLWELREGLVTPDELLEQARVAKNGQQRQA